MMIDTAYTLLAGFLAGFTCGAAAACAIVYTATNALRKHGAD
ncbi:hypothetical protein P9272_13805 [Mesorhizobium sp. WSM4976]|nr:hypothetical protein [Mesorhizobium sp. WSM4976]MDG4894648.1 hypothetical protein [Mesorhizobium sp. WSM4976]